ncbi:Violaxanthin de-epoxidase, chloroplastic [Blyttiomyces sp. JEL0837]|nr:Violaxanthin de-epoxidase, chloroplastic [Blyttiomyces sp. JEL0837]
MLFASTLTFTITIASTLVSALPSNLAAGSGVDSLAKRASPNVGCLLLHCGGQVAACEADTTCRTGLNCLNGCSSQANPMVCQVQCMGAYPSQKLTDLNTCIFKNQCVPKVPPSGSCPAPTNLAPVQKSGVTIDDLNGSWWVLRGLSPTYDYFACQQMKFTPINTTLHRYDYYYKAGGIAKDNVSYIPCNATTITDTTSSTKAPLTGQFTINYSVFGGLGSDHWYFLSRPHPDFALIWYCGVSDAAGSYTGGVVAARDPYAVVPDAVLAAFQKDLADSAFPSTNNVTFADYKVVTNANCTVN